MVDTPTRPAFHQSHEVTALARGGGVDIIPAGEFQTEEMILNIGPQHPATHGVLRIVIELDGEEIKRAEPVIGYMHRGAEKLAEYRDARQTLVLMNRHDWLSAFNNELGWTIAVERMAGIEFVVDNMVEEVGARPGLADETAALGGVPGHIVMEIRRTYYASGRPVETANIIVPAERYRVAYHLPVK